MPSLVLIDCESGALRRFESGGSRVRLTHVATPNEGTATLTAALIEGFRKNPPKEFAIEPPPQPPFPPGAIMPRPKVA